MLEACGRRVIVTGGSRGIGLAIARAFVLSGASKLMLVGRHHESLATARSSLQEASNRELEISTEAGNVKDRSFWESLSKEMVGSGVCPFKKMILNHWGSLM
jgi:NAD(P)-dependent dehydrogenase (short-subunit alcohol dehydrogenase family)